jgi:hypothetical protein
MYIEDHTFHIPSLSIEVVKMNPLVLTSPHASSYRRQNSVSSLSSTASSAPGSGFLSYSPPPSPTSSYFSSPIDNEDGVKVSRGIDLHARALLLLSLLYANDFSSDAPTPVLNELIHPSAVFEVEHFDASTSKINSRDEYLQGWSSKCQSLGDISSRIRECCVDESQRKVWVVNELTVGGKMRKESVDMLTFDDKGKMVRREGWLRRPKKVGRREED